MARGPIVVTGAAGFLGGTIARHLADAGWAVRRWASPESPRLPHASFRELLAAERPYAIVHAAGTSSVGGSFDDPARSFRDDVEVTAWVCRSVADLSPATRIVFLSSAAVYGEPDALPITEATPTRPLSPYGFHKLMAEEACRQHVRCFEGRAAVLRIFSAYGPGLSRQLLWDIVARWRGGAPEIVLAGTGEETRDFVFSADVARVVAALVDSDRNLDGRPLNVATGQSVSVKGLAGLLTDALGGGRNVRFTGERRRGDPVHWTVDVATLASLCPGPFVPIEEGVLRYLRWVEDPQESLPASRSR